MSKSGNLTQLSSILDTREQPTIYYAEDGPYLPRILIFYWPVQALGSLSTTSRIRTTILSAAGFKHFGAFSVAPSSSYYSAVHKLPSDKQRDDVCRAIAFALCRYFSEVPEAVKNAITEENLKEGPAVKWGQSHAAQIACKMSKVTNVEEIIEALRPFHKERPTTPTVTAPPVRMPTSIRKTRPSYLPQDIAHGRDSMASPRFTPSKRISSIGKRSPSAQKNNIEQLETIRYKMCEFVDTEDRYIIRVQELMDLVVSQGRTAKSISNKPKSAKTINAMLNFPSLLDQIKDLNLAFMDDIESVLQSSEAQTLAYLESTQPTPQPKDPIGLYAFAKVLLTHFPKFPVPYRSYLDLHSQISSNLDQFFVDDATSIQLAPSLLMEPAQRISRYGLYIDSMLPLIPSSATLAIRSLEKARKIIAEICEMEPAASTILDSLRIEHETKKRSLSPTKFITGLTRANTVKETKSPFYSGSLRDRDAPKLLPSLGRSFSKKSRRPGLAGILSEQTETVQNEERPKSASKPFASFGRRRPESATSSRPGSKGQALADVSENEPEVDSGVDVSSLIEERAKGRDRAVSGNVEFYKAQVMRLEQENYKLLAENAELKRLARECTCRKT